MSKIPEIYFKDTTIMDAGGKSTIEQICKEHGYVPKFFRGPGTWWIWYGLLCPDGTELLKDESCLPPSKKPGVIYFIQGGVNGPIKIGFTKESGETRRKNLQTGFPYKLELIAEMPGTREDEKRLFSLFATHRLHGEWFENCPAIHEYIKEHAK